MRISRIINSGTNQAKFVIQEMKQAYTQLPKDMYREWRKQGEYAQKQGLGVIETLKNQTNGAFEQIKADHLPALFAGLVYPTPVPAPIGYILGKLLRNWLKSHKINP